MRVLGPRIGALFCERRIPRRLNHEQPYARFELTGPVVLLGAVAIYHARFFWFAVSAALLCFATGHIIAIVVGVGALSVLFDPAVRSLFE